MNKYRIVMDFDIMADSPQDARNKSRALVDMYAPPRDSIKSWLKGCSILKLSVRIGFPSVHGRYKEIK
jgi:hypothetical protein|tara:strand:- start:457 stop:660 length:204 start_codon:yes stop_codon:yes gene_type:complete